MEYEVGPGQYSAEKFSDPRVKELIPKVQMEAKAELSDLIPAAIVKIHTKQGKKYRCRVDWHKGHFRHPMSDKELQGKFRKTCKQLMMQRQIDQIIETIYDLEKLKDVGDLMKTLIFSQKTLR